MVPSAGSKTAHIATVPQAYFAGMAQTFLKSQKVRKLSHAHIAVVLAPSSICRLADHPNLEDRLPSKSRETDRNTY